MAESGKLVDNAVPDESIVGQIDAKTYNQIARCARLLSVQLVESSFSVSPKFFNPDVEGKLKIDFGDVHAAFDEATRVATCVFQLESSVKKGKSKAFNVKSKFVVYYKISVECDDIHATAFARKVGLTACYPYFRAHVASIASMANADVPILPTISAMPVKEKMKDD